MVDAVTNQVESRVRIVVVPTKQLSEIVFVGGRAVRIVRDQAIQVVFRLRNQTDDIAIGIRERIKTFQQLALAVVFLPTDQIVLTPDSPDVFVAVRASLLRRDLFLQQLPVGRVGAAMCREGTMSLGDAR